MKSNQFTRQRNFLSRKIIDRRWNHGNVLCMKLINIHLIETFLLDNQFSFLGLLRFWKVSGSQQSRISLGDKPELYCYQRQSDKTFPPVLRQQLLPSERHDVYFVHLIALEMPIITNSQPRHIDAKRKRKNARISFMKRKY